MPSLPLSSAWLAVPLLLVAPRADEVTFGVAAGSTVTKTFDIVLQAELEESKFVVGDQEFPSEMEMTVESKTRLVFSDQYREMGEGRPKVLARTFDELTSSESQTVTSPMGDDEVSREETSELEGKTVVFTWSDEGDAFEPKFDGDDGDAKLLEQLVEDVDLRALLPGKEVAEGDTWDIGAKAFAQVFDPSGDVELRSEDEDESDEAMSDEIAANFTGKATGTFTGFREEEGARFAVIALRAELSTYGERDDDGGKERLEVELEVEGELLWHVAARRAHALHLAGPTKLSMTQGGSGETEDGATIEFQQSFLLAGTMTVDATWVAAE
jgi:hypothetical protein